MVVTTALCADQVATAASSVREPAGRIGRVSDVASEMASLAGRFAERLSKSLHQVMPGGSVLEVRQCRPAAKTVPKASPDESASVTPQPFSPFQFRLPPPSC